MEKISDPDRPSTPGLHRRDLDQDQHGAAQGLGAAGQEAQNQGSARPLEDNDLRGGIRRAIRLAGARLFFLPKYSPDLNPIEQVFAKLKHLLRKAAARTLQTVVAAIGELLDAYTAEECANYFKNAGYGQT